MCVCVRVQARTRWYGCVQECNECCDGLQDLQDEIDSLGPQMDYLRDCGEALVGDLNDMDDVATISDQLSAINDR